nr:desmethylxanthohumol 6'-O-methyltransferase-like [Ziziphus jujuba var. spinosa]
MELEGEAEALLKGQAEIWKLMFGFADSLVLKCAVELRIADIIHSYGGPITLSQIASGISHSPSPQISYLERIMTSLVSKKIFTANPSSNGEETLYGLTHQSRWLLWDSKPTLMPLVLFENHPMRLAAWHCISQGVKDGAVPFKRTHGCGIWEYASENPDFNNLFNDAMVCLGKIVMEAVLPAYKDGFGCIGSLVDVAGGVGADIYEIVKSHPHIKGINFDLPHVIATAPIYDGVEVSHVEGDMFKSIPNADAIFMKWTLHHWTDEHCITILKNCRKAIPEKTGKIIIVDIVFEPENNDLFEELRRIFDLLMLVTSNGGKERTEQEWKKLLEDGGFPRYKIIRIPTLPFIIEAYPI